MRVFGGYVVLKLWFGDKVVAVVWWSPRVRPRGHRRSRRHVRRAAPTPRCSCCSCHGSLLNVFTMEGGLAFSTNYS